MCSINALGGIWFLATLREWALIAMLGMEMVIYMAAEIFSAMKPRANANEDPVIKPLRAVVADRSAVIGCDVIVAIGAVRRGSNLDSHLSLRGRGGSGQTEYRQSS
jgi:hypothetical protein